MPVVIPPLSPKKTSGSTTTIFSYLTNSLLHGTRTTTFTSNAFLKTAGTTSTKTFTNDTKLKAINTSRIFSTDAQTVKTGSPPPPPTGNFTTAWALNPAPGNTTVTLSNSIVNINESNPNTTDFLNSYYATVQEGTFPFGFTNNNLTGSSNVVYTNVSVSGILNSLGALQNPSRYHIDIALYYHFNNGILTGTANIGGQSGQTHTYGWFDTQVRIENINGTDTPSGSNTDTYDPGDSFGFDRVVATCPVGQAFFLSTGVDEQFRDAAAAWGIDPNTPYTLGGVEIGTEGFDFTNLNVSLVNVTLSTGSPPPPPALTGSFTFNPTNPTTNQPVTFTSFPSGGVSPYTNNWNFGDGNIGTGTSLAHTYITTGSFNVVLTIRDSAATTFIRSGSISVIAAPLSTSFTFSPINPITGSQITFTGSASGGVSPYTFSWAFGDGGTSTVNPAIHSYGTTGSFNVVLTTRDNLGSTATASSTVTVTKPTPPGVSWHPAITEAATVTTVATQNALPTTTSTPDKRALPPSVVNPIRAGPGSGSSPVPNGFFIEIDNVTVQSRQQAGDGEAFTYNGVFYDDTEVNIIDPSLPAGILQGIHCEADMNWKLNDLTSMTDYPNAGDIISVQGYSYWDPGHSSANLGAGREIHALTAWKDSTGSIHMVLNPFNYTLANSGSITVNQGSSGNTIINAKLISGSSQPVTFVLTSSLPAGATATFNPTSVIPVSTGSTSLLTIFTVPTTPAGTYPIQVSANPIGTVTTPTNFNLVVNPVTSSGGVYFDFFVIILMENTGLNSVIGNSNAPFLTALANSYAYATNYSDLGLHPSQPNYIVIGGALSLVQGSQFGDNDGQGPYQIPANIPNIMDLLDSGSFTQKWFAEDAGGNGSSFSPPRGADHSPQLNFADNNNAARQSKWFTTSSPSFDVNGNPTTPVDPEFIAELNSSSPAHFIWLTPTDEDNMHNGGATGNNTLSGDNYIKALIPLITGSAMFTSRRACLCIVWDEDSEIVPCIFVGPGVKRGFVSATPFAHWSIAKTLEANWNLPNLTTNDAGANSFSTFFVGF